MGLVTFGVAMIGLELFLITDDEYRLLGSGLQVRLTQKPLQRLFLLPNNVAQLLEQSLVSSNKKSVVSNLFVMRQAPETQSHKVPISVSLESPLSSDKDVATHIKD